MSNFWRKKIALRLKLVKEFAESGGGVLRPAIGMKHKPLRTIPTSISLPESVDNELSVGFIGKKVDNDAQIIILC